MHELENNACPFYSKVIRGFTLLREVSNGLDKDPDSEEILEIALMALPLVEQATRDFFKAWPIVGLVGPSVSTVGGD